MIPFFGTSFAVGLDMRPLCLLALLLLVTSLAGCKTCEFVEAELRYQTSLVQDLEQQLEQQETELQSLRYTVDFLQNQTEPGQADPTQAYETGALHKIAFTRVTGGKDADRDGSDELLVAGISCLDFDGDAFKCPGSLRLVLTGYMPDGQKSVLGEWNFNNQQLREQWKVTLVSQGYQFQLPWKVIPPSSPVKLSAEFVTLDGRSFETEKELEISPPVIQATELEDLIPLSQTSGDAEPTVLANSVSNLQLPEPSLFKKSRGRSFSMPKVSNLFGKKTVEDSSASQRPEPEIAERSRPPLPGGMPPGVRTAEALLDLTDPEPVTPVDSTQVTDIEKSETSLVPPPMFELEKPKPAATLMMPVAVPE